MMKYSNKLYNKKVNAGEGYAIGDVTDNINEIEGIGELIKRAQSDSDIAIYADNYTVTMVGDAHGPWAVSIAK